MARDILLISDTMIKERTSIHGNIDPKLIYPDIKVAQDMHIQPLLGSALYDKLQTLIDSNTINDAANVNYKTLIDKFIVDALMYFTLAELPDTLSFQFWNKGVVRKSGGDTETVSMSDLISISKKYLHRAEFYANRLRAWVRQNAGTMFPEYLNPGSGCDVINPQKAFTSPIYLGLDDDDCCSDVPREPYKP